MDLLICTSIAFAVSLVSISLIIRFSNKRNIGMDHPGGRKVHDNPTPRTGGMGMALSFFLAASFLADDPRVLAILAGAAVIFAVGLMDDLWGIRWKAKMAGTVAATLVAIYLADIRLESLGNLFGLGDVTLGFWSVPFTVFCVLGVVNAINMIDGLNGLASGISFIALLFLGFFAYLAGDHALLCITLALAGSTAGFILFNYPGGRIFMGDSGSLLLGFSIAVISVSLFQPGATGVEPMAAILLLGLPIFDTLRVMAGRIFRGGSPFHADKTHIHHILLRFTGWYDSLVTLVLWLLTAMFCAAAVVFREKDGWFMLLALLNGYLLISVAIAFMADMTPHRKRLSKKYDNRNTVRSQQANQIDG